MSNVVELKPLNRVSLKDGTYEVTMTLRLRDAGTAREALDQAMAWRDAIAMYADPRRVTFDWRLYHPWGS